MSDYGAGPSWYYGPLPYPGISHCSNTSTNPEPTVNESPSVVKNSFENNSPVQNSSDSKKTFMKYLQGPDLKLLNSVSNDDDDDPFCKCGAGSLLGYICGVSNGRYVIIIIIHT